MVSTIGAFTIAVSMLVFFVNIFVSRRKAKANAAGRWRPIRGTPARSSG